MVTAAELIQGANMRYQLHHGDCLDVLRTMPDASVDAIVTDPPYGLSFMGKKWDYDVPSEEIWRECLRVLKPGGHLLAFAGTRTQHRMAVRIEDAGFEIRDMIAWVYGSGMPKSHDVSKAIDKAAGAEREVVGFDPIAAKRTPGVGTNAYGDYAGQTGDITTPATDEAKQWEGWGTALKPALEPITVARKPFSGTVAANVLEHGTGALNIDGCRIDASQADIDADRVPRSNMKLQRPVTVAEQDLPASYRGEGFHDMSRGRWPANFIHNGSEEVLELFPGEGKESAARYFYCAKASKKDRGEGNNHPTIKPTDLMRYLCRLVTPPNGVILDPFTGSGSTGKAAMIEGFRFIGIERESEYIAIARARIEGALK